MSVETEIIGRPAVLWRVEGVGGHRVECLAGELADHRYRVRVLRNGTEEAANTFADAREGVRWALEVERRYAAQGWRNTG